MDSLTAALHALTAPFPLFLLTLVAGMAYAVHLHEKRSR